MKTKKLKSRNWLAVNAFIRKGSGNHGSVKQYKRSSKHKGVDKY